MEVGKGSVKEDFVTVVSVGSQLANENFVTVLSIGNTHGKRDDEILSTSVSTPTPLSPTLSSSSSSSTTATITTTSTTATIATTTTTTTTTTSKLINGIAEYHLEEEVEVYRLPGERLGFGLKFEGGNKTSERVRRLFVQSCAEQSPASRAKCSWGSLGEGDEVRSISLFFSVPFFFVSFSISSY